MKRVLPLLAVVALLLTLLPGLLGGAPRAIANSDTPVPLGDARNALADARTPQPDAMLPASANGRTLSPVPDLTDTADLALVDRLQAASGPARVAVRTETGRVRFIGSDVTRPGFRGVATGVAGAPDAASRAFLAEYGSLFGIHDPANLRVMKQKADASAQARTFMRYQQTIKGIPVFGGELITQVDAAGVVWSASGAALPESETDSLPTSPAITAERAAEIARAATAKYENVSPDSLQVSGPELWYYAPALVGLASAPTHLVWRIEVGATDLAPVRELMLIDAQGGMIGLHYNQVPDAKTRTIYNNGNNRSIGLPGNGPVRSEGQGATGDADIDLAYDYAGDTYDFYMSRHGRDSIDGAGMGIVSTVRYCSPNPSLDCPYPNAYWNGKQMVYGEGYASADDVVGHELTHGVTDNESQLFYYMQSGAINESLSDIWGEFIDQTNGKGDDSASAKWLMGEDVPGGAIRSMKNPPSYGDPDRIGSSSYTCTYNDNGGVHQNSGVLNKAAFLITDGGTFNNKTVNALGLEKAVRIFYHMAVYTLASGAEYQDVYDLLPQACTDLAGAGVAGITAADCQQVKNAVDATQMSLNPSCGPADAPVCAAGDVPGYVYSENFEDWGLTQSRWAGSTAVGPFSWYYPQTNNPFNLTDLHYGSSGVWHLWAARDVASDSSFEMKQGVVVPSTGKPYLRFKHAYEMDYEPGAYYDGGVVEYSVNGGAWTDAASLFLNGGYNGTISTVYAPTNPLNGRKAFVAISSGYTASRLDLNSLKGQSVRFRWRLGTDKSFAGYSWFVDDVQLYACVTPLTPTPTPTNTPTPTRTPSSPWINFKYPALPPLSGSAPRAVPMQYGSITSASTAAGTITGGATFADGSTNQNVSVPVGSGEVAFQVKAKAGATMGTAYTLQVKLGSVTVTKTGKVAKGLYLPVLLK